MMKKALTVFLAAALLATFATPALAGDEAKVQLKTKKTAAVVEGDTAWVAISWTAKKADASDFRITASTNTAGVTISYPENTDPYSSLWDNDTLSDGEIDFTSLQVSVPYGSNSVKLIVAATWTSDGEKQSKEYKVKVPVAKFSGDDIAQVTTSAGSVSVGSPDWLGVEWTGIAPVLGTVKMTVNGPVGAIISYPTNTGTYTSLHYNDTLVAGETDIARFRVDASGMAPGKYTIDLELSYTKGKEAKAIKGQVSFDVTG
jgi:hypothetical protein